jgi:hypothetical protein
LKARVVFKKTRSVFLIKRSFLKTSLAYKKKAVFLKKGLKDSPPIGFFAEGEGIEEGGLSIQ